MGTHDNMYPLHTGFLTKSPPDTRVTGNFKRWRKRWFVLWEDKMFEYYADRGDPKPIKKIDLSRCQFLDTNLTVSAKNLQNIFSIKIGGRSGNRTNGRTYFLAAESPYEMTNWVDKICKLCDFKSKENNNNTDTTIRHQVQAPLDQDTTAVSPARQRDSGIIVRDGDTADSDLVPVKVVVPAYDEVPPPRPTATHALDNDEQSQYDVPPHQGISQASYVERRTSCPLDVSSSSESSLSSVSTEDVRARRPGDDYPPTQPNYDVPPKLNSLNDFSSAQPNYDVPPKFNNVNDYSLTQPNYDVPPKFNNVNDFSLTQPNYDVPPKFNNVNDYSLTQPNYDVPPKFNNVNDYSLTQPNYDVPPKFNNVNEYSSSQSNYDVPPKFGNVNYDVPKRSSGSSNSEDGTGYYDYPPSSQPTYDFVPAPVSAAQSRTLPAQRGLSRVEYKNTGGGQMSGVVQQFPGQNSPVYANYNTLVSNVRPGVNNISLSNTGAVGQEIYDHVPSRSQEESTYDTVPRPVSLPSGDTSCNYDYVPPPVPADFTDGQEEGSAPRIPRESKPVIQRKTYVNLDFPTDQGEYKKPLPNTPRDMQRDSGTVLELDEAVYDVPPVQPGHHAPCVDRTSKPGVPYAPRVDRGSKPGQIKPPDYVNLREPMRSATVRHVQPARKGGNVHRSKSAAADMETEGYLYMESPKRTDSTTRYKRCSLKEEEENDAYMFMQRNDHDMTYQNCDAPQPRKSSPERTSQQLRGHYQTIDIVYQGDAPSVPERSPRTQYTTIDLQKTKGFRKTCEDVGKDK